MLPTFLTAMSLIVLSQLAPVRTSFCDEAGWKSVWSDEFNGGDLDLSNWATRPTEWGAKGRNVDRLAKVEEDDIYVSNGSLVLRTQKRNVPGYNWTSGAVHTKGLHSWKGRTRACVRALLPVGGQGIQPAHWMMPATDACWPSNGEIDIMEMFVDEAPNQIFGTYIWKKDGCDKPDNAVGKQASIGEHWETTWHEFAVEYDKDYVAFALDGVVFSNVSNTTTTPGTFKAFDVPYYMILDTSVGSNRAGPPNASTVLPAYHLIDYVRISQPTAV